MTTTSRGHTVTITITVNDEELIKFKKWFEKNSSYKVTNIDKLVKDLMQHPFELTSYFEQWANETGNTANELVVGDEQYLAEKSK